MMLPMSNQSHGVPTRRARFHVDTINLDISAGLVGNPKGSVPLVEGVIAAEVQGVPGVGEGHPSRELAVEAN